MSLKSDSYRNSTAARRVLRHSRTWCSHSGYATTAHSFMPSSLGTNCPILVPVGACIRKNSVFSRENSRLEFRRHWRVSEHRLNISGTRTSAPTFTTAVLSDCSDNAPMFDIALFTSRRPSSQDFGFGRMDERPDHELQRPRPSCSGCNPRVLRAGSLSSLCAHREFPRSE